MTIQDWIAAAIALAAFFWLIWRFRAMTSGSGASCGSACSKCDSDASPST